MDRVALAIFAAALTLMAGAALAQDQTPPHPGAPGFAYHHMGGWHGMFFHPFGSVVGIIVLVFVLAMVLRGFRHGWGPAYGWRRGLPGGGRSAALEILEERFARGEIDKAEFEEKRRTLGR